VTYLAWKLTDLAGQEVGDSTLGRLELAMMSRDLRGGVDTI
jgi:hypothetical protein